MEERTVPAVVGYYDMSLGQGNALQVSPIQQAGHTPRLLTDLTAAALNGVDVLLVQNPDNDRYGAEFLSRLPDVTAFVASGKTLILHDRFVDLAETILPGGGTFDIRRNFEDPNNINVLPPANTTLINGPGGTVTSSNLDGGGNSSHGYAIASSLPADARLLLSNGTPTHIVDFAYRHGDGHVLYSTIPLDFQLQFGGTFRNTYAVNAVAYGVDLLNLAPVVLDATATLDEDGSVTDTLSAQDGDGDALTFSVVTGPAHGSVTFLDAAAGTYRYTPDADFNGTDSFTFRVDDGRGTSNLGTVTITVAPVNDRPTADAGADRTVDEGETFTVAATGTDVDGDTLSYSWDFGDGTPLVAGAVVEHTYRDNGVYSVAVTVSDGHGAQATDRLVVTVNNVAPQVSAGPDQSGAEGAAATFTGSFSDVGSEDTHDLAWEVRDPGDVVVATGSGLSIDFTPDDNGVFTVRFTVTDGDGDSSSATALLTVSNVAPLNLDAGPDRTVGVGEAVSFSGSFTDPGTADIHTLVWVARSASNETLAQGEGNTFTFTPAAAGDVSVTFTVTDDDGGSASVSVTVSCVNDTPVAADDRYSTDEDVALIVATPGVLANDTDGSGDTLLAVLVSGPAHGSLVLNPDGSFTYHPDANYNGPDSFTYQANDSALNSNVATVNITVNPVNDAPAAADDSYSTNEDTSLTVAAPGVLANDSDVDGDALTTILVSGPGQGTVTLNSDGSFTYTPAANYHGPDSFTYKTTDGAANSNLATASITVLPVNDAPVANGESYCASEDTTLTVAAPGVLANDTDVDGNPLTASVVSGPSHGTVTLNSDGSFTYIPDAEYNGPDSFTYRANDGTAESNVATVSLTVSAANDPPTAADDTFAVNEDQPLTVAAPGVLGNDGSADGDPLTAVLVSGTAHGTVHLNPDGSFSYSPDANYHGSDSFTYKVSDGGLESNVATVTLAITPVNDAPVVDAGPDQTVSEGSSVAFSGTASDVDGDPLSYLWSFGDGATATGAAPTHAYRDDGTYTVHLTVNDGQGGVTSASLAVTVLNVAPALTTSGASAVNEGGTYTLNLAASDPGQDTIANWTITWGDGSVQTFSGNPGSVSHTYADGPGTYTVSAAASDEDGTYNAGNTLNVTVNNVAPAASLSGPATGARGQVRAFTLGAADPSAADQAGSFTYSINWGDGKSQTVTGPANQQVGHVYTAAGTFTVKVTTTDKDGATSTVAQQTIKITAVDVQAGTLVIGGTMADDRIVVRPADASGNLAVTINGVSQGTFSLPEQIVIHGQSGNDQLKLVSKWIGVTNYFVTARAALFGDAGNDTLDARGSTANNSLVGAAGTDELRGGSGRDLLIGGTGCDTLRGNGGDDVVIGNSTDHDSDLNALNALMAEWGRTNADYATRISHLNGSMGGGLNGGFFLSDATVQDDDDADQLDGDAGSDWFFYTASGYDRDKLNDLVTGEVATAQ